MSTLIVLEGIDAAGKDTQARKLRSYLEERGHVDVLQFPSREGPLWKTIQEFLRKETELSPEAQFLLYAADIANARKRILAGLAQGTVLCNRYLTSTLAYQGAQGFSPEKGIALLKLLGLPQPDRTIYLKISAATSVRRKINEKTVLDRFESKEAFQRSVAAVYEQLIEKNVLGPWAVVDGEQSQDDVFADIRKRL